MSTAAGSLTTEQLIDACARQGIHVSATQLGRWVRAGLIPASLRRRHGRGRGLGAEWLWEPEGQARAIIIVQSLTTRDPSLMRAAHVLAAAGYPPDVRYLRQILLDQVAAFERLLVKRQPYLSDGRSAKDKRRRLRRNMRRWTPDMPEEVFQRFYQYMSAIFGVISLDEAGVAPVFHHIQEVISVSAMYQRLHTVEDTWLLAKYEEASQTLPAMGALGLAVVNMLLPAFAEWARRHNKPHASFPIGVDTENLLAGIQQEGNRVLVARENPMGELRLIFTLGLAIFPVEEEEILPQWARVLGELFSGLARYLNIPAKQAAMLDLPG